MAQNMLSFKKLIIKKKHFYLKKGTTKFLNRIHNCCDIDSDHQKLQVEVNLAKAAVNFVFAMNIGCKLYSSPATKADYYH